VPLESLVELENLESLDHLVSQEKQEKEYVFFNFILTYTVKPVLRGHLWDKDKVVF
jgi:hypothetical protein